MKPKFLIPLLFMLINSSYASCPNNYAEIGSPVRGHSNIKIDWIGKNADKPKWSAAASGELCFSADGKTCSSEPFSVVLNTGSETENLPTPNTHNIYSICMGNCYRSEPQPDNTDESPNWHPIKSCIHEFKATKVQH